MRPFVLSVRRSLVALGVVSVLLSGNTATHAQGIGFQGGATIDPEQAFIGTHFETGELFRNFRFRPGVDGAFGGDFSLATINVEFMYRLELGRSGWSLYQGGGPAIVPGIGSTIGRALCARITRGVRCPRGANGLPAGQARDQSGSSMTLI